MKDCLPRSAALLVLAMAACGDDGAPTGPQPPGVEVDAAYLVDSVRVAFNLPALAGGIVTVNQGLREAGVSGTRRVGGAAATLADLWHLGSNLKAFTGLLAAIAVERTELEWTTTLEEAFPELAAGMRSEYTAVTLRELLSHQSGLRRDPAPGAIVGSTRAQQRLSVTTWAVSQAPASQRGTYAYSNTGYMVAAAMIERALGSTFEASMEEHIYAPLGIADAGWGPQAAPGSSAQPVAHSWSGSAWVALEGFDNPPVYASAGGAHMSVGSWSRFLQEVLRLEAGAPTVVGLTAGAQTTAAHSTVSATDSYGMGWLITSRTWANGRTLTHDGSNTGNHSVVWMAPGRGFAVLAVTNGYDASAAQRTARALDALVARLITYYATGG